MSREAVDGVIAGNGSPTLTDGKRKRPSTIEAEELEIDLNQPEPPSKKAKRQQKKQEQKAEKKDLKVGTADGERSVSTKVVKSDVPAEERIVSAKKSEWSIWIGNLMWTTTKDDLREFLSSNGQIPSDHISRVHMPSPAKPANSWKGPKPVNKGFAYVDFETEAEMAQAIALSERLLGGRKVLIKNAKSFEGRPVVKAGEKTASTLSAGQHKPSKRVFVGGLAFDVTQDDLRNHFSQAGEIDDVFMATFEDSGKCKGFGFVRFSDLEAAQSAVRGYIYKEQEDSDGSDDDGPDEEESASAVKPKQSVKKRRKWFINRLHGKALRCEFAEDEQSRYKKRFSRESRASNAEPAEASDAYPIAEVEKTAGQTSKNRGPQAEDSYHRRPKHKDSRLTAPGKALASAQRATAAIVASAGTKTTFS